MPWFQLPLLRRRYGERPLLVETVHLPPVLVQGPLCALISVVPVFGLGRVPRVSVVAGVGDVIVALVLWGLLMMPKLSGLVLLGVVVVGVPVEGPS